ncbi:hypothetical protein [Miltoncostaea oceani]|uniref:hypothetical protein n=1 Tax=Miltoncostaea oceani TaxID=2843216 RepID=UPI001C3CE940|nr:hypothetical protein [Miltoncostaea oceani]
MSTANATWSWAAEELPAADDDGFIQVPIDLDFASALSAVVTVRATFATAGAPEVLHSAALRCVLQDTIAGDSWFPVDTFVINDGTPNGACRVTCPMGTQCPPPVPACGSSLGRLRFQRLLGSASPHRDRGRPRLEALF